METWHIQIGGQVQGVGFRPFVYKKAISLQLKGWVNNSCDGVHIEFNAESRVAQAFYSDLIAQAPRLARITSHQLSRVSPKFFDNFQIIHSKESGEKNLLLTPDVAICPACTAEVRNPSNRRYAYPFTTCTDCGVRFSIIEKLPYDRPKTSMSPFKMCTNCQSEYEAPLDRRYYSQTNSCPSCRIELLWLDKATKSFSPIKTESAIQQVIKYWEAGKIVAIKGVGGFLLTCDASNPEVIQQLRQRKNRPQKPFALMVTDLKQLHQLADVKKVEEEDLSYPVAAISLLKLKTAAKLQLALDQIAPGLDRVGFMLAYTPLYQLLLDSYQKPIIATSGNISNSPIIYEDSKAEDLLGVADVILSNERRIMIPQDDSVIRYTNHTSQKIILRRSRGWAPTFIQSGIDFPEENILALGAMLKSTFTLLQAKNTYVSQYLGDLQSFDTEQHYRHTIQHFLNLLEIKPDLILMDEHPAYSSTRYGIQLAQELGIASKSFQHHLAHFGAILGEHKLLETSTPILGFIWDGTGLGTDGQIWGGESFVYQNYSFERKGHLAYFPFFLGDKMPKEPRISVLAMAKGQPYADFFKPKFSSAEWKIYTSLLRNRIPLKTSSMGRLFDAVASCLDLRDTQTYEGEAAMLLEKEAQVYIENHGIDFDEFYSLSINHDNLIPVQQLLELIIQDIRNGKKLGLIAAKFHLTLVKCIQQIAHNLKIKQLAFSGGVFQNALLVDLICYHLGTSHRLFWHQQLSPNDENISYGQLVCELIERKRLKKNKTVNTFAERHP